MAELMQYEKSARFTAREKIALRYADAIMYDPNQADDAMWASLRGEFTEPELVELGYWIGFTFGGQRWQASAEPCNARAMKKGRPQPPLL